MDTRNEAVACDMSGDSRHHTPRRLGAVFPHLSEPESAPPFGSPCDIQILRLLAAGATDESIARHLGISGRTVQRRVRALMDDLGVQTRFQAGVQSALRHWC